VAHLADANQHQAIDAVELAMADYEQLFGNPMIDDCAVDEQIASCCRWSRS